MSVVKNKRTIASTQFLTNLQKLQKEVLTWCKQQGNKNAPYGLTTLFTMADRAFIFAWQANKTYLKDEDSLLERKELFNKSIKHIHSFNAELTGLMFCYNISNEKLKRWSGYAYQAINQMESIKESDRKRIKKKK